MDFTCKNKKTIKKLLEISIVSCFYQYKTCIMCNIIRLLVVTSTGSSWNRNIQVHSLRVNVGLLKIKD